MKVQLFNITPVCMFGYNPNTQPLKISFSVIILYAKLARGFMISNCADKSSQSVRFTWSKFLLLMGNDIIY